MTLKEKFDGLVPAEFGGMQEPLLSNCVQIADEFSIGFLGWFKKQVFLHCEWSVFDLSEKEILEIYKKEKGL